MNNEIDDSLDLLDLEDDAAINAMSVSNPFASPRPKRPWLLMGVGLLVIVLASYIIVRTIGSDNSYSVEIDLSVPEVVTLDIPVVTDTLVVPPVTTAPAVAAPAALPATPGVPVSEINDRKEVKFNPNKSVTKPAAVTTKTAAKPKGVTTGGWYVQFGSYSQRASAETAQKRIKAQHSSLFTDKQFVILAAVLPNGTTTYRLRVAFKTSTEANGFCRNAKSDGLDCYVAK